MSRIDDTQGFRLFAGSLERTLSTFEPPENLLLHQKAQLKALILAETTFRKVLQAHAWGPGVYEDFVKHICEEKKNILAARPYFRERQTTFTAHISKALKQRNAKGIYRFRFNWTFVTWVLQARKWRSKELLGLAKQIESLRNEILEQNLPLAISQARIFWNSTPKSHLSYMDIVQIQCQGLLLAIDKFTPPNESKMTAAEALTAWQSFRGVAVGIMRRDRVNHYSIDGDVILVTCDQQQKKIKDFVPGDRILGVNTQGQTIETCVVALHDHGTLEGYEVTFDDGYQIVCSEDHKFLTQEGMVPLKEIGTMGVFCEPSVQGRWLASEVRVGVSDKENRNSSCTGVSGLSAFGHPSQKPEVVSFGSSTSRRVEDPVWYDVFNERCSGGAPQGVLGLRGVNQDQSLASGWVECVVPRAPGEKSSLNPNQEGELLEGIGYGPREEAKGFRFQNGGAEQVAQRTSGRVPKQFGTSQKQEEGFQNGNLVTGGSFAMGVGPNSLRGGTETGRLCKSGPQNLGGSGRSVSLYRIQAEEVSEGVIVNGSSSRCDAQSRGSRPKNSHADSDGFELFLRSGTPPETGMAGMAYSHAPLASTGSLVLRNILRIRPVGARRMYDIEVSHPKHNFLLPNGIVTSNSETLVHFYPGDKLKIYIANRNLRRFAGDVDYIKLATIVNNHLVETGAEVRTTPEELAGLLSGASTVSGDFVAEPDGETVLELTPNELSARPDSQYEEREAGSVLHAKIADLSIRERKLLIMKGISI